MRDHLFPASRGTSILSNKGNIHLKQQGKHLPPATRGRFISSNKGKIKSNTIKQSENTRSSSSVNRSMPIACDHNCKTLSPGLSPSDTTMNEHSTSPPSRCKHSHHKSRVKIPHKRLRIKVVSPPLFSHTENIIVGPQAKTSEPLCNYKYSSDAHLADPNACCGHICMRAEARGDLSMVCIPY